MQEPEIISEKVVFEGVIFDVVQRKLRLETGQEIMRQIVVKHDSVVVILVNDQQEVYLQHEYRSGLGHVTDGVVAGLINPYEDWEDAALREVQEETGYHLLPMDITYIGSGQLSEGFTNEASHVFVAYVGSQHPGTTHFDGDEYIEPGQWVDLYTAQTKVTSMAGQMGLAWLHENSDNFVSRYQKRGGHDA